jgi:hypothetical protein
LQDHQLLKIPARQSLNNQNPSKNKMLLLKMSAPLEKPGVNTMPTPGGAPAGG